LVNPRVAGETADHFRLAFTNRYGFGEAGTARNMMPRMHVPSERPFWVDGIIRRPLAAAAARRAAGLLGF
jgi:hypothetical protein